MGHYSIYLLDHARHLHGILAIKCAADAEALEYARKLVGDDGEVDLWVRGQCPDVSVSDHRTRRLVSAAAVVRRWAEQPAHANLREHYQEAI